MPLRTHDGYGPIAVGEPLEFVHFNNRFLALCYLEEHSNAKDRFSANIAIYKGEDDSWSEVAHKVTDTIADKYNAMSFPSLLEFRGETYVLFRQWKGMGRYSKFHIYRITTPSLQEVPWHDY